MLNASYYESIFVSEYNQTYNTHIIPNHYITSHGSMVFKAKLYHGKIVVDTLGLAEKHQ
jgi:hypothetical protein